MRYALTFLLVGVANGQLPTTVGALLCSLLANECLKLEYVICSRWLKAMQKYPTFVGVVHWQCRVVSVGEVLEEQFMTEGWGCQRIFIIADPYLSSIYFITIACSTSPPCTLLAQHLHRLPNMYTYSKFVVVM